MEMSPETIEHLRDEAYAMLCRSAVTEALEKLEREKVTIAETRPPFGILASKHTRDEFARSTTAVTDAEAALRTRLGQVIELEKLLEGMLQEELAAYLSATSADYQNFATAEALLDRWEIEFGPLQNLVMAFAREIRNAEQGAAAAAGSRDFQLFAVLREAAVRVENQLDVLDKIIADIAAMLPPEAAAAIQAPALPNLRRVAWVSHIATLPAHQLGFETSRVGAEAREFISGDRTRITAFLASAHLTCKTYEENFLQHYWNQLRAHAQAHYVKECAIDDVIGMLMETYVTSDIARRQKKLTVEDPFASER